MDIVAIERVMADNDRLKIGNSKIRELIEENKALRESIEVLEKKNVALRWKLIEDRTKNWPQLSLREGMNESDIPKYDLFRFTVLDRDKRTCQDCGQCGRQLIVHHVMSWKHHPALRYDPNNGVTLCDGCHNERHNGPNHLRRKDHDLNVPF